VRGGEAASIEFAVAGLGVKDIIVCGHSHCGAMKGLISPPSEEDFPALSQWLLHAEVTKRLMRDKYRERDAAQKLGIAIQENVLAQLENLRTHPVVASALSQGRLKLHGWVYKIETGEVFGYDPETRQFLLLTRRPSATPTPCEGISFADV
jgi:carbonic anhydrase